MHTFPHQGPSACTAPDPYHCPLTSPFSLLSLLRQGPRPLPGLQLLEFPELSSTLLILFLLPASSIRLASLCLLEVSAYVTGSHPHPCSSHFPSRVRVWDTSNSASPPPTPQSNSLPCSVRSSSQILPASSPLHSTATGFVHVVISLSAGSPSSMDRLRSSVNDA